jgi:hypothetical protein
LVERNLAKVEVESSRLFSRSRNWRKRREVILENEHLFCDNRCLANAGVAQLVERNLAKVEVESSRLFSRSSAALGFAVSSKMYGSNAGVAQLVERNLAKVEVESSRLFSRSRISKREAWLPFFDAAAQSGCNARSVPSGEVAKRLCSGLQSRLDGFDSRPRLQISK